MLHSQCTAIYTKPLLLTASPWLCQLPVGLMNPLDDDDDISKLVEV